MTISIQIEPHPLLDLRAFVTHFSRPLGDLPSPPELQALLAVMTRPLLPTARRCPALAAVANTESPLVVTSAGKV